MNTDEQHHAPEPWTVDPEPTFIAGKAFHVLNAADGPIGAMTMARDDDGDARRIVACVNACAGTPTARLKALSAVHQSHADNVWARLNDLQGRLDALVAAAEAVTAGTEEHVNGYWWSAVGIRADDLSSAIQAAKAAKGVGA